MSVSSIPQRYLPSLLRKAQAQNKTLAQLLASAKPTSKPPAPNVQITPSPTHKPKPKTESANTKSYTPISKIMTEEAMKLDATKLGMIWTTYHHERDITSAVAKEEVYSKLQKRMAECPMAILAHQQIRYIASTLAHQTFIVRLAEYQQLKEAATPMLVITHYPLKQQEIVLIRAIGEQEFASALVTNLKEAYLDDHKYSVIQKMHRDPQSVDEKDIASIAS